NQWLATGYCSADTMPYGCPLSEGEGAEAALLIPGYRKALTAVTSAGVPPNRYATSTVSLISASVAPAARARLAMLATPSAWAVMASTIMVMRILYLAGMAPSCRIRSRCAMYDSANCGSRCWRACIHGGVVGCAMLSPLPIEGLGDREYAVRGRGSSLRRCCSQLSVER